MRRGGWAIHMIPGLFGPTKKALHRLPMSRSVTGAGARAIYSTAKSCSLAVSTG